MSRSFKKNWSFGLSDKFFKKEHHVINRQRTRQELLYGEEADVLIHQSEYDKGGINVWDICDFRKYQGPGRGWEKDFFLDDNWKKESWSRKLKIK